MYYAAGEKQGKGYDEGLFDVTTELSLIIKNVSIPDEGRYFCEVSDFETGILFRNYTDVTVFGKLSFYPSHQIKYVLKYITK